MDTVPHNIMDIEMGAFHVDETVLISDDDAEVTCCPPTVPDEDKPFLIVGSSSEELPASVVPTSQAAEKVVQSTMQADAQQPVEQGSLADPPESMPSRATPKMKNLSM